MLSRPFSRGSSNAASDTELLVEAFVAFFRISPHNNDVLKVCIHPNAQLMLHCVLAQALHRIITQASLCLCLRLRLSFCLHFSPPVLCIHIDYEYVLGVTFAGIF